MKKKHADISFYTSVTKIMIISYTVPEIWRVTAAQKFKIKKNKKTPGDILILHMCTKKYDQMTYNS